MLKTVTSSMQILKRQHNTSLLRRKPVCAQTPAWHYYGNIHVVGSVGG